MTRSKNLVLKIVRGNCNNDDNNNNDNDDDDNDDDDDEDDLLHPVPH